MTRPCHLIGQQIRGAAAVEMALVLPVLLALMFGSVELGNYFMNEHSLVKAVRDGARFAARQNFSTYTACSGEPGGSTVSDTKNVVINGYLSGGAAITPNISASDITVETACSASSGGQTMLGIYRGRATGAQIVTVSATVDYRSVLGLMGFSGFGLTLNASSQAAVTGL
jgi:Flp pilus assembly protein TadG